MDPYFTVMRLPGEPKEEFILLLPFNPSGRDNMIALLAARSDAPNYGRLIAYAFPKQKLVFGPRNIDARINQDPIISQQISLWNQQGNRVLRGSLYAIPIDESLIYVLPLYLAAEQGGALPELRRVVVAYGNQIAMEPSLEAALARIFGGRVRVEEAVARPADRPAPGPRRGERADPGPRPASVGRVAEELRTRCAAATGRPTARSRRGWRRPSASSRPTAAGG